jgi:hypothetical protein
MNDAVQLLQDLLSAGFQGIVIIGLIITVALLVLFTWLQRKSVQQFTDIKSGVELSMQARREEVESLRSMLQDQRDALKKYQEGREIFENDVRRALEISLLEIKSMLGQTTVSDIISQIPENFRKDVENEIKKASSQATVDILSRLSTVIPEKNQEFISQLVEQYIKNTATEKMLGFIFSKSRKTLPSDTP